MADPLRVGVFSPSPVLALAASAGTLAAHGLTVEEVPATSSSGQFADLAAGRLHAVVTSPDNVLAYRASADNPLGEAMDVRILAAVDRGLGLSLFAAPGLDGDDALRGGVLGVDVPSSGFAFVAYALLARRGLEAGRDYEVRKVGTTPRRADALVAGACTSTVLNAGSDLRAEAAGCRRLARAVSLGPYVGTVLAARGDTVDEGPPWLVGLTRVVAGTCREIASGHRRADAAAMAEARLGLGPEAALAFADTLATADEGLVADGRVDAPSLETLRSLRGTYGQGSAGGTALAAALTPGSGLVDARFLPEPT